METGMKGSFTTRKGALYCIVMTCLCSLLATGCASKYGAQTTDVHYYPDCYQPIADLRSAEKSFNTTMVMGTTMGALLGAVIGASQTGKAEGALAGAAIGAGAGAGASYLVAKYNNERDDRVRLASYARDLNADVNSLNRVTAAGQVAYNCYSAKFRAALEDYKAKRITRAELDQRYAEIKSGLAEASPSFLPIYAFRHMNSVFKISIWKTPGMTICHTPGAVCIFYIFFVSENLIISLLLLHSSSALR